MPRRRLFAGLLLLASMACSKVSAPGGAPNPSAAPTADDARTFLTSVNATLLQLGIAGAQAGWVAQTYITDDTEALDARANAGGRSTRSRGSPRRRPGSTSVEVPADQRRQLNLLKLVAGAGDAVRSEGGRRADADRVAACEATYGKGKWCPDPAKPDACLNIDDITRMHGDVAQRAGAAPRRGRAGTPSRRRCGRTTRASSSCRTRARGSWASPTPARCGARSTTCRPTRSPRSSIGCGSRCGRSTCSCTPTCA